MILFTKYENYLLRFYLRLLLFNFFITQIILVLQFFWVFVDEILGKGIPLLYIGEMLFWASIGIVPMSLSIAILLSSIMTIGAIGENSELVVLRSAGISLFRLCRTILFVNMLLSVSLFYFNNYTIPASDIKMRKTLSDIKKKKSNFLLKPGIFNEDLGDIIIRVEEKIGESGYRGILLYDHSEKNGNNRVILADSASMDFTQNNEYLIFTIFNGVEYFERDGQKKKDNSYQHLTTSFNEKKLYIDFSSFQLTQGSESRYKGHYRSLKTHELLLYRDSMKTKFQPRKQKFFNSVSMFYKRDITKQEALDLQKLQTFLDTAITSKKTVQKLRAYEQTLQSINNQKGITQGQSNTIHEENKRIARFEIEWHRKFSSALLCFAFLLIGLPLGAVIRKGGMGLPMIIALICFVASYVFQISFEKMAKELTMNSWVGMWIPVTSFLILGLALFLLINYNINTKIGLQIQRGITFIIKKNVFKKLKKWGTS